MTDQSITAAAPASTPASHSRRPGRRGPKRRIAMGALLLILCAIIFGYWMLTDSDRVRALAQRYLARSIGGRIQIEQANVSLFGGLQLRGVAVYVDDADRPDSLLFSADAFIVKADLVALASGDLDATQIVALAPRVHLCENVDEGEWNYQRLKRPEPVPPKRPSTRTRGIQLPQIMMRGGIVERSRIVQGRYERIERWAMDGRLAPASFSELSPTSRPARSDLPGRMLYRFDLEMRSPSKPSGAHLGGWIQPDEPWIEAALPDLEIDQTIRAMLPSDVQKWWQDHRLSGKVRIPRLCFSGGARKAPARFHIEIQPERIGMIVPPGDLLNTEELADLARTEPPAVPQPIVLEDVSGAFVFTQDRITLKRLAGRIEGNVIELQGAVDGYDEHATGWIRLVASGMEVPQVPRYLLSLPSEARRQYEKFKPQGKADLKLRLERKVRGGRIDIRADLDLTDAGFCFEEFQYPLRRSRGRILFVRDAATGNERVEIRNLTGYGVEGSVNERTRVTVNGWISPLGRDGRADISVVAHNVQLDDHLRQALPHDVRDVVAAFDRPDAPARMYGAFQANITRQPYQRARIAVDLDIQRASGAFKEFPYPLEQVSGKVKVRPNYVELADIRARGIHGSPVRIDGHVAFGKGRPVEPEIMVHATDVPIDEHLLAAMPEESRRAVIEVALGGLLDVDGNVFLNHDEPRRQVDFELGLSLRDGRIWRRLDQDVITGMTATARLTRSGLVILDAQGSRGGAALTGSGQLAWPSEGFAMALDVVAENLRADPITRSLIPAGGRSWYDDLRPEGYGDVAVQYRIAPREAPDDDDEFTIRIRPRDLTFHPHSFPWKMLWEAGQLEVSHEQVSIAHSVLRHGDSAIELAGHGNVSGPLNWNLRLRGREVAVDEELREALPEGIAAFFNAIDLSGRLSFDAPDLTCRAVPLETPIPATATRPARTTAVDVQFKSDVTLRDGGMDVGLDLSEVQGKAALAITVRDGSLQLLDAVVHADLLRAAGRPVKDLRCHVVRNSNELSYRFRDVDARFGGGRLGGNIEVRTPEDGPSGYLLSCVMKDIDLRDLLGDDSRDIRAAVTASIDLEGNWSDGASRFGRGDVHVTGEKLVSVPVILGWLQIVNLALPSQEPFDQADLAYAIRGNRITFEEIVLRAPKLALHGSGSLDFATRKVLMSFVTENPDWPRVPVIGEFLSGAKKELFQIHVSGTVRDPKVEGRSMNLLTTTIDEVINGEPRRPGRRSKASDER